MPSYHVNKNAQPTGEHEVHETGCAHQPDAANRDALGWHSDCHGAVREARKRYNKVDGCYYCCKPCHTR